MEAPETRYADADGVRIAYQELGSGARTLVIVTNWATNLEGIWHLGDWTAMTTRLAREMRIVVFDFRGTGMSDRGPWSSASPEQIADIQAVLDAAAVDSASLLSTDMGSVPVLRFAAAHPERVDAIVLLGGTARLAVAPGYDVGIPMGELQVRRDVVIEGWGQAESLYQQVVQPGDAFRRQRAELARVQRQAVSPSEVQKLVDHWLELDARDAVAAVDAPALIMHAVDDGIIPVAHSRWLAAALPHGQLVELSTAQHFLWTETRRQLVEHVLDFVLQDSTRAGDGNLAALVMTDIVDSTTRAAALGADAWRHTLDEHDALIRDLLRRHDGVERSTAGDSFLATFTSAGAAVAFALEANRTAEATGVQLRVGVHVGDVVERDGSVHGLAVHVAARAQAAAAPGVVAATSTVRDALLGADDVGWTDLGPHELKGVPGTWTLWSATSAR